MNAAAAPRPDLPALTGIRGVAAWLVVLYHIRLSAAGELPDWTIAILSKGYLAVDFFFMLSGFVLWLNYAEPLRAGGLAAAPHFIARRVARIWPLHILILGGTALYAAALATMGQPRPEQFPLAELPLHILLMQNWGFTRDLTWNDPAWSISCEFAAYLLFPILVMHADWRRLSTGMLIGLLAALALMLQLVFLLAGADTLDTAIPRLGIARALIQFVMGTILCALWSRWRAAPNKPLAAAAALAVLLAGAGALGLPEMLIVPILFAALLLVCALTATSRRNMFGWRPIHYLGEISYATYLLHYMLFVLFKLLFAGDANGIPLPMLGFFLLLVLVGSILLHHGVERPAQRMLNRAWNQFAPLRPRARA